MAPMVVTTTASARLESLVLIHSLPIDIAERPEQVVRDLRYFPELGPALVHRRGAHRFLPGPWWW